MDKQYTQITPEHITDDIDPRPVHIQYGSVKMDLPRLDDSRQMPTAVMIAGMSVASKGWDNLDENEQTGFMAVLLAWLSREYPRFERELDTRSGDKIKDIGLVFQAWTQASKADPKA
ncbi:hypothetical protein [Bifidobacterium callimiconis]|uniref:Uncharacterized protein n=1 Tax=Bifidobacterium callimiconis TaxID=2306973 RepID=A0A430FIM2_9BIFI|nr:hypothetical protein [Bifidobacterium callimiconis]RSX52650.1 hypothetical protein D2E23_0378 [Bifidobacterium callimiconis]